MKLSILTPSIPERLKQVDRLTAEIERQAAELGRTDVEHLVFIDNRRRSIGAKRQALVDISRGEYVAFVDDDDRIRPGYVRELLAAADTGADVLTFRQMAHFNDLRSEVRFKLGQGDGPFTPGGQTDRDAWHVCAWRRDVVAGCQFGESNYGEDLVWCRQARKRARNTVHIPKILHEYRHSEATTAAPAPG